MVCNRNAMVPPSDPDQIFVYDANICSTADIEPTPLIYQSTRLLHHLGHQFFYHHELQRGSELFHYSRAFHLYSN